MTDDMDTRYNAGPKTPRAERIIPLTAGELEALIGNALFALPPPKWQTFKSTYIDGKLHDNYQLDVRDNSSKIFARPANVGGYERAMIFYHDGNDPGKINRLIDELEVHFKKRTESLETQEQSTTPREQAVKAIANYFNKLCGVNTGFHVGPPSSGSSAIASGYQVISGAFTEQDCDAIVERLEKSGIGVNTPHLVVWAGEPDKPSTAVPEGLSVTSYSQSARSADLNNPRTPDR